jgi:hypothetical protein
MNDPSCTREADVVQELFSHGELADDLAAHVKACPSCADVLVVVTALRDDREWARGDVAVPAAGQVWWRAAVRARLEATQAAARPLTWAHGIAAAATVGLVAGVAGMAWPTLARALGWAGEHVSIVSPAAAEIGGLMASVIQRSLPAAVMLAAALLLAPLAVYLALTDD